MAASTLFAGSTILLIAAWEWPRRWLLSGAAILQYFILLGDSQGNRILPFIHLWPLSTTLHLLYAIASTSWLLYWVFAALCYPAIFLTCLFQFSMVGDIVRRSLRSLVRHLHFIDDKVAFFDIPALEIDTEVDGLMVLRGITFSLSTLSFVVHGVEVGIKLSDDMELAIQTEEVKVSLFRGIEVGDCFANLKGGQFEMTFGNLGEHTHDEDGDAVFVTDTQLLRAATLGSNASSTIDVTIPGDAIQNQDTIKITEGMTGRNRPRDSSIRSGFNDMKHFSPDNELASGRYFKKLDFIKETCLIQQSRTSLEATIQQHGGKASFDYHNKGNFRAAICSQLHSKPSVPHPPQRSIKVTTLQNLAPPSVKRFMHRLPMLLRLLLNPLGYFHPVKISSITATASGCWIESMLVKAVFKDYGESESAVRHLKQRITAWLVDANFAVELGSIIGLAQIPLASSSDIICNLGIEDVMAYRSLPKQVDLKQVVRMGGADATFMVPSFLLPHHEHILPAIPTQEEKKHLPEIIEHVHGKPKKLQAEKHVDDIIKDLANVKMSVHAHLPACFDQELLDFIAALVKVTKVVEFEKAPKALDEEVHGIREFSSALKSSMKSGMKKAVVDGMVNDRWISKMVGKITRKLEEARGDVGYSGDIPVDLGVYRTNYLETEGDKLLP